MSVFFFFFTFFFLFYFFLPLLLNLSWMTSSLLLWFLTDDGSLCHVWLCCHTSFPKSSFSLSFSINHSFFITFTLHLFVPLLKPLKSKTLQNYSYNFRSNGQLKPQNYSNKISQNCTEKKKSKIMDGQNRFPHIPLPWIAESQRINKEKSFSTQSTTLIQIYTARINTMNIVRGTRMMSG